MSSIPGVINLDIVLRNYVTLFKVGLKSQDPVYLIH